MATYRTVAITDTTVVDDKVDTRSNTGEGGKFLVTSKFFGGDTP